MTSLAATFLDFVALNPGYLAVTGWSSEMTNLVIQKIDNRIEDGKKVTEKWLNQIVDKMTGTIHEIPTVGTLESYPKNKICK